jgi:mono/diheme cytochrome c family protein
MNRTRIPLLLLPVALLYTQAQAQPTPGASDVQAGKEIWTGYFGLENDCKLCHGVQGEGGFGKPLAGHKLTAAQFIAAVRKGPGIMPAFVADKNLNDQQLTEVSMYLASLPAPSQPNKMWQTMVPPLASENQKLMINMGCGQCHGQIMANPRRTGGGAGADYAWFQEEVYNHTSAPGHVNAKHLRMGNFTKQQVSEANLQKLWQFFSVEQGLRAPINADISKGVPGPNGTTYTINVANGNRPGKGLTAEYLTVVLPLLKERDPEETLTVVTGTTGGGYIGVYRDPIANAQAPEFMIDKLAPGEKKTFTITLKGKGEGVGIPRGYVTWARPKLGTGATDLIGITVPY